MRTFAVVWVQGRPVATYSSERFAQMNCRHEDDIVIPVPDDRDPARIAWNAETKTWVDVGPVETVAERRANTTDPDVLRTLAYRQDLDRGLQAEVVLEVALALVADPGTAALLRQSTRDKAAVLSAKVAAIKAAHPKP